MKITEPTKEDSQELHRLGSFTLEMIRTLTKQEQDKLLFLYKTVYNPLLPIGLEDPIFNEIGRMWRMSRERMNNGVKGEHVDVTPWYLAGKECNKCN